MGSRDSKCLIVHGRFSGWDVLHDEAMQEESKSGLPILGDSFVM